MNQERGTFILKEFYAHACLALELITVSGVMSTISQTLSKTTSRTVIYGNADSIGLSAYYDVPVHYKSIN